ncbi:MAG: hypothetical protein MMC23_003214 [Stictis urceolatum]|nr:hypothetical protein [Stictis urceolata]
MYSARASLPPVFYHTITLIEPLLAFGGALQNLLKPEDYLHALTTLTTYDQYTRFLYTQLAGAWLVFAFNEAIVMRFNDDLGFWRLMCLGMLLSDVPYCWSTVEAAGGWSEFVKVGGWRAYEWMVFLTTMGPVGVRACVAAGIGLKGRAWERKRV